jgi:hypothetical protein
MVETIRSSVPPPPPPASAPVVPPTPAGVDGFAVAALVVGLAGGPVFGIWLATVAIRRIRAGRGNGMWMAVTGLVASIVWTLALLVPVAISLLV